MTADQTPQEQGTYHWIMTLRHPSGTEMRSADGTYTPPPGTTRYDAQRAIRAALVDRSPDYAGSLIVFFSLEPNRL